MLNKIKNLVIKEEGQGLSEYGLLLAGIVVVVGACIFVLKGQLTTLFGNITDSLKITADGK